MPKFIKDSRLAHLTAIETAAQSVAGADVNLALLPADEIEAALATNQLDEQALGEAALDALFSGCEIPRAEGQSHEDALGAFNAPAAAAVADLAQLREALGAAGLALPTASAEAPLTADSIAAHLQTQFAAAAVEQSISAVAAAGATPAEIPDTSADAEPATAAELLASYEEMPVGAERTAFFSAHKKAILAAMGAK